MPTFPDFPSDQHLPFCNCPQCDKRTVVRFGEKRYACLSCGWWEDVDYIVSSGLFSSYRPGRRGDFPVFLLLLVVAIVLALGTTPTDVSQSPLPNANTNPTPGGTVLLPEERRPEPLIINPPVG